MSSLDVPLWEFMKGCVGAWKLSQYWYCAAKLALIQRYGFVMKPEVQVGAELHEEEGEKLMEGVETVAVEIRTVRDLMEMSKDNILRALRARDVLANREGSIVCALVIPELEILGVPDVVDCTSGVQPVVVELKYVGRLPSSPWFDHKVQVTAYTMGLETLGFSPPFAVIQYVERGSRNAKTWEIEITKNLKEKVRIAKEKVKAILSGKEGPIPTKNPRKCKECPYLNDCEWSCLRGKPLTNFLK